jgi:hypothetical protein
MPIATMSAAAAVTDFGLAPGTPTPGGIEPYGVGGAGVPVIGDGWNCPDGSGYVMGRNPF